MAEQDEDEKDGGCLIELLPLEKEGGARAEEIARADAEQDQHGHVEHAVAQGPHGGDDERPGRVENGCGRKKE